MTGLRKKATVAYLSGDRPALPPGLRYRETGKIAVMTLSRPAKLNALTFEIYAGLRDLFKWLEQQPDLRAVILTGEGRGFCSGGDVDEIIGKLVKMTPSEAAEFTRMTCEVVANMRGCPQPIVAAINGTVAGAGAALAVAADIRIAVPNARISFLFIKAGLSSADMGASLLLPRLVGLGRATELLLTGDFIDARTAFEWGLYNKVVPDEHLMDEAQKLAAKIAEGPQKGIPASKKAIDRELAMSIKEALAHDARVQAELMQHPDFQEAFRAFEEKRPPKFA